MCVCVCKRERTLYLLVSFVVQLLDCIHTLREQSDCSMRHFTYTCLLYSFSWYVCTISQVERIIFCVFLERDWKIYRWKLQQYFPEETESREKLLRIVDRSADKEKVVASEGEEGETSDDKRRGSVEGREMDRSETNSDDVPMLLPSATEPGNLITFLKKG